MKSHNISLESLLLYGDFPEPLLEMSDTFSKIWRRERKARVIQQDLRDLANLKDFSEFELLADTLPTKVGSLLSYKSLAEDLEKSPHTIERWIEILESIYYCYTILPYGSDKIKAVKKSKKLYLWDCSEIEDEAARFENFTASHLLKFCHYVEDTQGDRMEVRFLRDHLGKEIDFILLKNKKPLIAVECKIKVKALSPNICILSDKLKIPKVYQVHLSEKEKNHRKGKAQIVHFKDFCRLEKLI